MQKRQEPSRSPYREAGRRTVYRAPAPPQQVRRRRRKKKKRHPGRLLLGLVLCVGVGVFFMGGAWRGLVPKVPGHYTIALDAGHGGVDLGATGLLNEVDLTEATVRALEEMLRADPHYTPVLCRPYGEGMGINERAAAARNARADLLISVHGNAEETGTASGFECYPLPPGRKNHDESLKLARLMGHQMRAAGSTLRGEDGVRYAYYVANGDGSYEKRILDPSADSEDTADSSFGVLEGAGCPAVLAEQCFITNEQDVAAFGTAQGCRLVAARYYLAICDYFGTQPVYDEQGNALPQNEQN